MRKLIFILGLLIFIPLSSFALSPIVSFGFDFSQCPTIGYGRTKTEECVQMLQGFLLTQNINPGIVDGKFGPKTRQALIKFQNANGLIADGLAGKKTFSKIIPLYILYQQNFGQTPSIQILSPNGGEVWQNGQTYTISWNAQNVPANTWIELFVRGNISANTSIADIRVTSLSGNSFSWTIPADSFFDDDMVFPGPLTGTNLRMVANLYDVTGITNPCLGFCPDLTTRPPLLTSDESDGVFTILP